VTLEPLECQDWPVLVDSRVSLVTRDHLEVQDTQVTLGLSAQLV